MSNDGTRAELAKPDITDKTSSTIPVDSRETGGFLSFSVGTVSTQDSAFDRDFIKKPRRIKVIINDE